MKALRAFNFNGVNIGIGDTVDSGIISLLKEKKGTGETSFDRLVRIKAIESVEVVESTSTDIDKMSKNELIKFARINNIEISTRDSKSDILAVIESKEL